MGKIKYLLCLLVLTTLFLTSEMHAQKAHTQIVEDVKFSSDGTILASLTKNEVNFWNPPTGDSLFKYPFGGYEIRFLSDEIGKDLVVISQDKNFLVLNYSTGEIVKTIPTKMSTRRGRNAITPDGKSVIGIEYKRFPQFLILQSLSMSSIIDSVAFSLYYWDGTQPHLAYSEDGNWLFVVPDMGEKGFRFSANDLKLKDEFTIPKYTRRITTKGEHFAASHDWTMVSKINAVNDLKYIQDFGMGGFDNIAFNPADINFLLISGFRELYYWNWSNPKNPKPKKLKTTKSFNRSIAFSPDGKLIALGTGHGNDDQEESVVKLIDVK